MTEDRGPFVGQVRPVLVLDDGTVVELTVPVVLGRDPAVPPELDGAVGVRVDDLSRSVTKTHCAVGATADGVVVQDLHSVNGTSIEVAGTVTPCLPGTWAAAPAGATIRFGSRTAWIGPEPVPATPACENPPGLIVTPSPPVSSPPAESAPAVPTPAPPPTPESSFPQPVAPEPTVEPVSAGVTPPAALVHDEPAPSAPVPATAAVATAPAWSPPPSSIAPTVLVTLFFGLFGLIPASIAANREQSQGRSGGRYWRAFWITFLVPVVVAVLVVVISVAATKHAVDEAAHQVQDAYTPAVLYTPEVDETPPSASAPAVEPTVVNAASVGVYKATTSAGDSATVTVRLGSAVPLSTISDSDADVCDAEIGDDVAVQRTMAVPVDVSVTLTSSLTTKLTVVVGQGAQVIGTDGELSSAEGLLAASVYSDGPDCNDGSGSQVANVTWQSMSANDHGHWAGWLLLPGAITPSDPVGTQGAAPGLLLHPTVALSSGEADLTAAAGSTGLVTCSGWSGDTTVLAVEPSSAAVRGCKAVAS